MEDQGPDGWKDQWKKPWGRNVPHFEIPSEVDRPKEFFTEFRDKAGEPKKGFEERRR